MSSLIRWLTAPAIELARRLVELSFADSVFFANSGAEAVEAAVKFARLAGGEERREIVHFDGSFHGRTLGALTLTGQSKYHTGMGPLLKRMGGRAGVAEAGRRNT